MIEESERMESFDRLCATYCAKIELSTTFDDDDKVFDLFLLLESRVFDG
jgi:hypothetical protein